MHLKFIKDDDYINYKKCGLFLGTIRCSWKCCIEQGLPCSICQNNPWSHNPVHDIRDEEIITRYIADPLTESIVFGGLEPFDQFDELFAFIEKFRAVSQDDIVIYTGYTEEELKNNVDKLKNFPNIIIKFGRFIPNQEPHYDEILGIKLASNNQYAVKIS